MVILGDFNAGTEDNSMKIFCKIYSIIKTSLQEQTTCYKNLDNLTSNDFILTNIPCSFQNTWILETRLSFFHLMTLTFMRQKIKKFQPRVIHCKSYKNFSNECFTKCLLEKL